MASSIGFDTTFAIDSNGRSGGIGILWNNTINIEILGYFVYHIDFKILDPRSDRWRLTVVYGEAQTHLRHQTWEVLRDICGIGDLPWLCLGDFNEVLRPDEHEGIGQRSNAQIQGPGCGGQLHVAGHWFQGQILDIRKKVAGGTYTRVRLDKALGYAEWSAQFPLASLSHLTAASSDHSPILLQLDEVTTLRGTSGSLFWYEIAWDTHENMKDKIQESWAASQPSVRLLEIKEKLASLSSRLRRWNLDTFGSVRKEIKHLKKDLERCRNVPSFKNWPLSCRTKNQ